MLFRWVKGSELYVLISKIVLLIQKISPSSKNFEMREQNLDEDLDEAAQHRVHLRRDITHHRLTQDPLKRLFI